MPRPSKKVQRIAEKVVPGLRRNKKNSSSYSTSDDFLSEVEIKQTNQIDNKRKIIKENEMVKI